MVEWTVEQRGGIGAEYAESQREEDANDGWRMNTTEREAGALN